MLSRTPARSEDPLLGHFDAALFAGPMLLIGADNTAVGVVDHHAAAAAEVAAGRAMTWAAQVRPGVVALDVDLDRAALAALVLDDLTGWCRRRGLWHTSRPSGGGPGRHHLVVVAGPHESDLLDQIAAWRAQLHVGRQALDVRAAIRPLSAPHRSGRATAAAPVNAGDLAAITAAVRAAERRPRPSRTPPPAATSLRIVPTQRCGPFRLPATPPAAGDGSRSASEFVQTVRLANAGATADEAWQLISTIRAGKAATKGRTWWERYMWSRIRPIHADSGFNLGALVLPVMAAVRPLYSTLETRQRHTLETVLVAILERLQRAHLQPVALSERDLSLATRLSRPALRAAGERAVLLGVLARSRSARQDAAWVWELGVHALPASSLNGPSILTPRPSHWLHASPAGSATTLIDHHLDTGPALGSTRQRELHTTRLTALRQLGVLGAPHLPTRSTAAGRWRAHLAAVTAERDAFYAGLRDARASRQAPYHRRILARRRRQLDWWARLSPAEQEARRTARREYVATLSPHARHQHLRRLRSQGQLLHHLTIQYPPDPTLPIPVLVPNPVL